MLVRFRSLLPALLLLVMVVSGGTRLARGADPAEGSPETSSVRALMVTGGCCHDYQNQKKLISEGLSKRIGNIDWTILEYGSDRDVKADIYTDGDWIEGFDMVVHNECFGAVEDPGFVQGIVDAHVKHGVPAIVIHCSMHSYRTSPAADSWRAFLGVTSRRHEKSKHSLRVMATEEGKSDPILASMGDSWDTPNGELYIIEQVWPETKVLARVHSEETNNDEPVIWTNQYKGVRVFGISLGHHNETIETETWQSIVAAGWKWSMKKD